MLEYPPEPSGGDLLLRQSRYAGEQCAEVLRGQIERGIAPVGVRHRVGILPGDERSGDDLTQDRPAGRGGHIAGASPKGRSSRQTKSGASRSALLTSRKHVPDRVAKPARDVDLGDLGAALRAEPALVCLVARGEGGVLEGVHGRLEQRQAQIARAAL